MPLSLPTRPLERELDERDRVCAWRLVRLVEAGYRDDDAVEIACSPTDLHEAVELVQRGCPSGLAVQILL
jgi:hypothetical protein